MKAKTKSKKADPREQELQHCLAQLVEAQEEADAIESEIQAQHGEDLERIADLRKKADKFREQAKTLLREMGRTIDMLGYSFRVSIPHATVVDTEKLVRTARERGELDHLIEYGVVTYTVVPDQIERLPGTMKAAYSSFVTKKEDTPRVTFPDKLK
jgi:hypothetical protein